ncbi:hypothetical protein BFS06_12525 [Clostridium perfringens]|uniref:CRISPR-associated protein Cas5 n=1 Tax=Clostridium perfringens TaxID=1502 RepID=A0A140GR72_CLOPF|nr:hypothetical protein [Clostridium perfringens]AMN31031.1 hypothetical protein JFP838_pA0115 [Clostridium perfringens]TBX15026.1 hypothetical protein BFS06_12525 [Clostridium perfringens]
MLKVTYKINNMFSLRKFGDSHLCARSYEYPMLTTIRGALLGSLIQRKGIKFAEDNFNSIAKVPIYIQIPKNFVINETKLRMLSNNYLTNSNNGSIATTVGIREYIVMDKLVFYIDDTGLDFLREVLVNIDRIGSSDSMVEIESMELVDFMENILVEWTEDIGFDYKIYELYDWSDKTKFENRYIYSNKASDKNIKRNCYIKEKVKIA